MNHYKVQVIDQATSEADAITVYATDELAARKILSDRGYVIGEVESLGKAKSFDLMQLVPLFAGLLIVVGVIWMLAAWKMDTRIGATHDIGRIADREVAMEAGRTILTCAVIAFFGSKIILAIRTHRENC